MMRPLGRLLRPSSIAMVGGGSWGRAVLRALPAMGFAGSVHAVHPRAESLEGIGTVAHLRDLPAVPDAVFVGVNRTATIPVVAALSVMGAGGAVCFASGFAESGDGADLNAALLAAAGDMPILGPNCYGFINALDGAALWPDVHGLRRVERGVAILTQSSNIALNLTMNKRGLPIAYIGSVGNQAQIGLADLALEMLEDSRVTALGLHVEGIGDLRRFEALADAAARLGKPVIVLKSGRTEAAARAAVSHTASLAGSDAGAGALLRRLGMARVFSLEAFLEALKLAHAVGPLRTTRIAALCCSGGEAGLIADAAAARGLPFAPLTRAQRARLGETLGSAVPLANPLDYQTYIWSNRDRMAAVFADMMAGDAALTLLVADFPRADRCRTPDWDVLVEAAIAARVRADRPLAIVSSLPDTMPEQMADRLLDAGLVPMGGLCAALDAVAACCALGVPRPASAPLLLPGAEAATCVLTETEAKSHLRGFGLPVPDGIEVADVAEALTWAKDRYPVALKVSGRAHKTESGGVALGLNRPAALRDAMRNMKSDRYLVEAMVDKPIVELLVGVLRDPAHGFVLTLGSGGVLAEVMQDTAQLLLPASEDEIRDALDSLRIAPLLAGYRGNAPADLAAVLRAVLAVQACVVAGARHLEEVEINPLIVTASGAVAADALIRRHLDDADVSRNAEIAAGH